MTTTRFTELVGCAIPVQQAEVGAVSPPELAVACRGRALGIVGTARSRVKAITLDHMLDWMQEHTARPCGVDS